MSGIEHPSFELKKKNKLLWSVAALVLLLLIVVGLWFSKQQQAAVATATHKAVLKIHYEPAMIGEKSIIDFVSQNIAADYGLTIEAVPLQDSIQANRAVADGEYDATIHQHQWWLKQIVDANGFKLSPTTEIFQWAFGVYSEHYTSMAALPDGAKIAIPNDLANQAQALWLLARDHWISLNPAIEPRLARIKDIQSNPHHFQFIEIELLSLPRALVSVDAAIGYVLQFDAGKIARSKGIYFPPAPRTFASRLVVASNRLQDPQIVQLEKAFADPRLEAYLGSTDDPNVKQVLTAVSKH
jgi:D-methionine transport system substrate-binding protein